MQAIKLYVILRLYTCNCVIQDSTQKTHAKLHQQASTQGNLNITCFILFLFWNPVCLVECILYCKSPLKFYIFLFVQMQEFEKWLYQNPEIMDNVFGWQCPSPEGEIID